MRSTSPADAWLTAADAALRTLFVRPRASRPCPTVPERDETANLSDADRALAGALMRVNHVGEVCAQALYTAQALAARQPGRSHEAVARQLEEAGREETDHLAWTQERLDALGARPSLLNPLWYAGAFGRLPAQDHASRAVVAQMKDDEARHAREAQHAGASELPAPVKGLMRAAAKVMTTVAHRI